MLPHGTVVVTFRPPDVLPVGMIRIGLDLPKAGTTTVHVVVRDKTTNELLDQVDIPVIVHPPT